MVMKQFCSIVFLVLWGSFSHAQLTVKVVTMDRSTRDPVHRVDIALSGSVTANALTNKNGIACFKVASGDSITINCEHLAYASETRDLVAKGKPQDTITVTVFLRFVKTQNLNEFVVYPKGVPRPVFKSERVSVDDFEFLPDGKMVLLTYARTKKKGTELCLYDGEKVVGEINLKEPGNELIRDFRGNPHVVTNTSVYGLTAEDGTMYIGELAKDYYMSYIAPIVDTTISKYFFSNYNPSYPAFEYYTFGMADSAYRKIANIEDELMMELYRSEYKWVDVRTKLWAKEMEHETGIDAEIWVGANYFTQSVYYKELYAPLFERNDTVFVFDHYKNLLFSFDREGDVLDSVPIFYHLQPKQTGWQKLLIQDQLTGQVYSVYESTGQMTLRRIDLATGELKETIPLYYKYPDKILIRGNRVYYTYREFETAQKKYLYEEKLPFDFPEAGMLNGDPVTQQ